MSKKFLFLIILFQLIGLIFKASSEIIPIKKPILSEKETQKKLLIDVLKPLPKPVLNKIIKSEKKETKDVKSKKIGFILPKKKPLIAGTKKISKNVKISKFYSKKDFNFAKKAIEEMKKAKWPSAIKYSKKAKDKSIYNFIQWRHLLTKGNRASFNDYKKFIQSNENYPRIGRVKYLAEHKLSTEKLSPKKIIEWFGSSEPLSGFGKMILGESFILINELEKGKKQIKEGWITAELSKSELRFYRKNSRNI